MNRVKRLWCKSCNDWTLFDVKNTNIDSNDIGTEPICQKYCIFCGTNFIDYSLSEISEEKLIEQRKRYCEQKSAEFRQMMGMVEAMSENPRIDFSELNHNSDILETDAGLEAIRAEEKRNIAEQKSISKQIINNFRNIGRNDPCNCGSGKKYKNCHLKEINQLKEKYE